MRRHPVRIAGYATVALVALVLAGCGSSGKREGTIGPDAGVSGVVQKGDPVLAAAPGYIGSEACINCHPNQFVGWSRSLHNAPLKTVAELGAGIFVNDYDANGVNDFDQFVFPNTLNLGTLTTSQSDFTTFADNAPLLYTSVVGGAKKYIIRIGTVEYEVQRIQGGNGYWKQRYQTRIGKSYYVLPVQYNEKTRKYANYNASHWYVVSTPRFTGAYSDDNLVPQLHALQLATASLPAGQRLGTVRSWENRCAGCHQTGLTLEAQTTNYGGTNAVEAVTGYVELNIGCEKCHGPGAQHVSSSGNPAFITNPANLTLLGVEGIRLANQVCGNCHQRGEGRATLAGLPLGLEYPARFVGGVLEFPLPGQSSIDNSAGNPFVTLNTAGAYFGAFPSAFGPTGDDSRDIHSAYRNWYLGYNFPIYIASSQHHQQWTDMEQGPHAPDKSTDTTCWGCHDPHKAAGNPAADPGDDHQIRDSVRVAGVDVPTRDDNNTLCLACHADDFGLTVNDVRNNSPSIRTAVLAHMGKEAVMGDANIAGLYDPAGTGVGRCSKCHMPLTASSSGQRTTLPGSKQQEGDIHNHTFNIIWPSANVLVDNTMVNSCYASGCHANAPGVGNQIIAEWSESGHANFKGEPFRHWDRPGSIPTSCAKCHSPYGFNDFALDGVVNEASELGHKISCGTCHTEEGDGTTLWDRRATYTALAQVVFPSGLTADLGDDSNICMACHQGRESKVSIDTTIARGGIDNLAFVNIHYFAAAATLFGTQVKGGYEYDNNSNIGARTYVGRFAHVTPLRDTCIKCHMNPPSANHTFFPRVSDCQPCHANLLAPTDPANPFRDARLTSTEDFDGDGDNMEGLYFEIWDTLMPDLLAQIQIYAENVQDNAIAYDPNRYPYWIVDTNGNGVVDAGENARYNAFDATLLKAAYNYHVVQKEPCGYIHNARYIIQLIIDSIEDLAGPDAVADYTRPPTP